MNWKKHPHLFVNGMFEFLVEKHNNQEYIVSSYSPHNNSLVLRVRGTNEKTSVGLSDITLMARPIEDMTDEEKGIYQRHKCYGDLVMTREGFLHLLSIGVYPFSDTEDVIFKPKNEHASN